MDNGQDILSIFSEGPLTKCIPTLYPEMQLLLQRLPTKEDLRGLIEEDKDTFLTELHSVKEDLPSLVERVEGLESAHDDTRLYIAQLQEQLRPPL
ncbi:hypothetical protein GDO81_013731 [Engystomops pustulosus]|uniref:Uncharacterized protein n=1 Tax=Engystomops pustulosus TaxID=76066 RepID=A0AAV7B560_ENGPU|nr:hypothetical protein GDO81_013731 [Engystomops pustulosus]